MCVCVCVCVSVGVDWGWEAEVELMDKVSRAIRQKHHNQAVSSMPPSPCSLPLLINTGIGLQFGQVPGQQGRTAQPFSPHRTRITQQNSSKKHLLLTLTHNGLSVCVWGSGFAWTKCPHKDTKPVITYIVKTSEPSLSVYLSVCLSICLSVCLSMRKMAYIQKKSLKDVERFLWGLNLR